jgi:hypothetical protein
MDRLFKGLTKVLIFVVALMILIALYNTTRLIGPSTTGTVTRFYNGTRGLHGTATSALLSATYEVDGQPYGVNTKYMLKLPFFPPNPGDKVRVVYDKDNPRKAFAGTLWLIWQTPLMLIVITGVGYMLEKTFTKKG